ncbi:MAG: sulfurtransferase [Xanthomonadales bacterium]|jgi:rhodanese-related sulfurtransferase|nr:sulfurtransferase [Xanthomonadales bacterium]
MTLTANDLIADARTRVQQITAAEVHAKHAADTVLIDVREPGEFAEGHLPGAINLPRGVLEFKIEAHPALACDTSPALADRQRAIVVYCLSGGRSMLACDSLQRLGFTQIRSLTGGIAAWREAGLPVTRE